MKANKNTYDVIIIGSGMGALTAGSLLAQLANKRILILERNFKAGGFTHIFKRKGEHGYYKWDVGLHYVGNMAKGEMPRALFDYVTQGGVKWKQMPDNYDTFIYPDIKFKARAGRDNLINDLINEFPDEEVAIKNYFDDLKNVGHWINKYNISKALPDFAGSAANMMMLNGIDYSQITLKEYLDKHFNDEKLKAVLASQWGDYGLPPSQASFVIHAVIVEHYANGGYYPIGGAKTIADSIIPIIESKGGKVLLNNKVEEIIIDDWKAVGVRVSEKPKGGAPVIKEYFADTIISNTGAQITYQELLPPKYKQKYASSFDKITAWTSHVNLYLGLKENVSKLGIQGENLWIFNSYDHDEIYNSQKELITGKVNSAFVSFPGAKDPEEEGRSVEVIAFAPYESFEKWKNQPWKNRDEEYQSLKNTITEALLNFVEKRLPGFKELVDYKELSTPLSTQFFTGNYKGNIYGIPSTPERYKNELVSSKTPIKNLYLTGADTSSGHGIVGALMGGVVTAGIILGNTGIMKIFKRSMNYHKSIN